MSVDFSPTKREDDPVVCRLEAAYRDAHGVRFVRLSHLVEWFESTEEMLRAKAAGPEALGTIRMMRSMLEEFSQR